MRWLLTIKPDIVIHTSGPFQAQGYDVAKARIVLSCLTLDLADGREFVEGITTLDSEAKESGRLNSLALHCLYSHDTLFIDLIKLFKRIEDIMIETDFLRKAVEIKRVMLEAWL